MGVKIPHFRGKLDFFPKFWLTHSVSLPSKISEKDLKQILRTKHVTFGPKNGKESPILGPVRVLPGFLLLHFAYFTMSHHHVKFKKILKYDSRKIKVRFRTQIWEQLLRSEPKALFSIFCLLTVPSHCAKFKKILFSRTKCTSFWVHIGIDTSL